MRLEAAQKRFLFPVVTEDHIIIEICVVCQRKLIRLLYMTLMMTKRVGYRMVEK
jgi:hypothetical protein